MAITLKYASTRAEIMQWYWRMWRRTLWKFHLVFFAIILLIGILLEGHWPIQDYRFVFHSFILAGAVIAFLVGFPQIMYKPQVRTLTVSEEGIQTVIGSKSGKISWRQVKDIEDTSTHIIITNKENFNAFIVPYRAFPADDDRRNFITAMQKWLYQVYNNSEPKI